MPIDEVLEKESDQGVAPGRAIGLEVNDTGVVGLHEDEELANGTVVGDVELQLGDSAEVWTGLEI